MDASRLAAGSHGAPPANAGRKAQQRVIERHTMKPALFRMLARHGLAAMPTPDNIAVIANHEGLDSQALLSASADAWRKTGAKVAGVVAENNTTEALCSAGYLRDLASGRRFSVQLDAPSVGTVCHLDTMGMEDAGTEVLSQIPEADIVIFSKFGKLEAMQKGLWPAFSAAISAGKPILTTVSARHIDAWKSFAPGATWLEGDQAAIDAWWRTVAPQTR